MNELGLLTLRGVGIGMIAIGAVAAYGAARLRILSRRAHGWPTVQGRIVASEVESRRERASGSKPTTMHGASIRYAYTVGGKTYESDQVQLGASRETSEPAEFERMVARYPEGKRVKVYYDPSDPHTATLEPGKLEGVFNLAMVGGGFMLVGAIVVVMTYVGR